MTSRKPGQIKQRGKQTYLVRVFLGRDSQTGKRQYHNHTIHGSKTDAQKYLNQKLRDRDLGLLVQSSSMTLNTLLDQWLETVAKLTVSEVSLFGYKRALDAYVRPKIGNKKLSNITPLDIQKIYSELQQRGLAAWTIRQAHTPLRGAFRQAVKWQFIVNNPCLLVDVPKRVKKEMKAFSFEEAEKFRKSAESHSLGFMYIFALETGMRPEEYLSLQWKDVDLERRIATVQRALIFRPRGGGYYFSQPKTPSSRRTIELSQTIIQSLKRHKAKQGELRLKAGQEYNNLDLVFADMKGEPLKRLYCRYHFKAILRQAKLSEDFRLYDLRHSMATLMLAMGINPKVVSERLGHSDIAITLGTYTHVLPTMQREACDKFESALFPSFGTQ